jgi:glycosyltransferase involved in cell wall biosynthesis
MKVVPSPHPIAIEGRPAEIQVLGSLTRYWEYGAAAEEADVTLVAVHGFRGDHHGLESVVAFLCDRAPRLRVLAPDLPGFGVSEPFAGRRHDVEGYGEWLSEFLDALGLRGTAVLLGHSFGTIVVSAALAGGLAAPRAILINPIASPALSGPNAIGTRLAVFYYWLGARLPERPGFALLRWRAVTRGMSVTMAKSRDRAMRRWIHNQHDRFFGAFATRDVVLEAFRASVGNDVSEFAARIPVPVHLIAAEKDDITPVADQYRLRDLFPQATLEVLPGVGHLIHYEVPEAAARGVERFLLGSDEGEPERTEDAEIAPRVVVDCRYIRADGRHDGISRYSAGIVAALARRMPLTMLISDPRQLALLPPLPWHRVSAPTSPLEPLVAAQVNRAEPDVVFSPMQTMGSLGRRYRLVLTLHDLIYYRHRTPPAQFSWWVRGLWRLYHLAWWPQRLLLNRADAVVTVSETTKRLMAEHRLTRRPVTVVPNAAELSADPIPPREAPGAKSLVYMGAFIGYKNVETLVRAAALLPDYELHLMSRVRPEDRERLESLAPGARLVFHNGASDEEYRAELLEATALVTASLDEGFGIPLVEAMSVGTPVVVSDIPIFREVGGDVALYADAEDPAAFAAAIRRLQEPGEWAARSAASLDRSSAYSWDASAEVLADLLRKLAAEVRRSGRPRRR